MPDRKVVECELGGRTLRLEAGHVARQSDGAVWARYGDTVVIVAAVCGEPREGLRDDFLPLTIEYREKVYAAGKFPGGFIKREGRPSTNETLGMRLIDRPIRPLFPAGFINDTQIHAIVASAESGVLPDVIALNAASASLLLGGAPLMSPIGAVRVGRIHGRFLLNPTKAEIDEGDMDLVVCGAKEGILMVEAGCGEVTEDDIIAAFEFAQPTIRRLVDAQRELAKMLPPTPREFTIVKVPDGLVAEVRRRCQGELEDALFIRLKRKRNDALDAIQERLKLELVPRDEAGNPKPFATPTGADVKRAYALVEEDIVRKAARAGRRADGRGLDEVRPIHIQVGVLPRAHGSALFTRGETQALVTVTLGTWGDSQIVDGIHEEYKDRFMLHYNFPPFSTGETKPIRGPGRREIGHGVLAQRALATVVPEEDAFPYTVRVVSEILESNGSSSMASVCGGSLALMDAGVPVSDAVAGIAMGLVEEGGKIAILTDILGSEDALGDMDFKVAGTARGITSLQMDLKRPGIDFATMRKALEQARKARLHVLAEMGKAIGSPRAELSTYAPRVERLKIPVDKIGLLIGPGGKTINAIQETTGVEIEVEDDGTVLIYCRDAAAVARAKAEVEGLTQELIVGRIYQGRVSSIRDFGAFVEIVPGGNEGLVHITEMADGYVQRVEDVLQMGQEIPIKVIEVTPEGKKRFSYKQALVELGQPLPKLPEGAERPPRGDRDRGGPPGPGGRDRFRSSRPRRDGGGPDRGPSRGPDRGPDRGRDFGGGGRGGPRFGGGGRSRR